MKKVLFPILALVLALSLALPMAAVVGASPATKTVVSDDSGATVITKVYNKALGVQTTVTPTTPLTPVRAWEPAPYSTTYPVEPGEATDSTWDNGVNWFEDNGSLADWIWETHIAEDPASYAPADPLYDADAARYGRVVLFETTFNISGNPISATLHIAADNGYEAWVNSGTHYRSLTAAAGWETSNLHQASLTTSGWQSYGTFVISGSELVNGSNTLYVLAGNEYFGTDDGDSPVPPTQGTWGNPDYHQYNPGAAIFQLDVEYEEFVANPGINIEKSTRGGMTRAHEGDSIIYIYTVTNTGNVPLSSVAVTDPDVDRGPAYVSGDDGDGILQTTETWIYRAAYVVPYFFAGPVTNTGTAEGYWEITKVTDTDDFSVAVVHNPDIEVTKAGPDESGYFEEVDPAEYTYTVTNTGDCALIVELVDSVYGILEPDDGDTYLLPEVTWHYTVSDTLICEGYTMEVFTNIATATGEDAIGQTVEDCACWSVIIFQWQPRTIGYWGNWENHYAGPEDIDTTPTQFGSLLAEALNNSTNLQTLEGDDWYDEGNVHDFLLGKPPTFKGDPDGKAQFLMEKQFLATWLNVKAYWDWTGEEPIPAFPESADVGMDPDATVYLTGDAAHLFGLVTTVGNILDIIELEKGDWTAEQLATAQVVLDKLNNAEDNGYEMFIPPNFNPASCRLMLENKNSTTWEIEVDETWGELYYNCSGDEFEYVFSARDLEADTDYSLIYYADYENRYVNWGGDNPGKLIAEMTTDGWGSDSFSGSVDLGMDLPSSPDKNIDLHDYSIPPDNYSNAHGAKIWLVPSDCLTGSTDLPVIVWAPDRFLFETDLIWYTDTDD